MPPSWTMRLTLALAAFSAALCTVAVLLAALAPDRLPGALQVVEAWSGLLLVLAGLGGVYGARNIVPGARMSAAPERTGDAP